MHRYHFTFWQLVLICLRSLSLSALPLGLALVLLWAAYAAPEAAVGPHEALLTWAVLMFVLAGVAFLLGLIFNTLDAEEDNQGEIPDYQSRKIYTTTDPMP